ncbi:MAG: polysaccharide deacetylase family protein [SAR324 cluster bacterium]|nr:polysaccharide deacetylase family protein [SAR324 cluster bacterium]
MNAKELVIPPVGFVFGMIHDAILKKTVTIFTYHDVTDTPGEFSKNYGLNVPPKIFEDQLHFIKKYFNLISPDDLLSSKIPHNAALITFDDGLRNVFTQALPLLEKHHIPFIVFLNMGAIQGDIFWSGLITYLCDHCSDFMDYLKKQESYNSSQPPFLSCSQEIVTCFLAQKGKNYKTEVSEFVGRFASEDDLKQASQSDVIFYGNHLFNHYVPLLMSDEELVACYQQNVNALQKYPNYRNFFAFPFGQPDSCFSSNQVALLLKNGAQKVFRSSATANYFPQSSYLDRLTLNARHNSSNKIWFQLLRQQMNTWKI